MFYNLFLIFYSNRKTSELKELPRSRRQRGIIWRLTRPQRPLYEQKELLQLLK